MAAVEPKSLIKDNAGPLLIVVAVLLIVFWLGSYYGSGNTEIFGLNFFTNKTGDTENEESEENTMNSSDRKYDEAQQMQLNVGVDYSATIQTNMGEIEVDLYEDAAPMTVNNFVVLAEDGFYKDLIFHRVVEGFVIQGGDPLGTGTGGPGYSFKDEINPDSIGLDGIKVQDAPYLSQLYNPHDAGSAGYAPNSLRENANMPLSDFYDDVIGYDYDYSLQSKRFEPGVLAMANSGPNTNGSQFFITVSGSDTSSLNGRHTVFGKVLDGMDVVDKISKVLVDDASKPVSDVVIERVTIHED
jgi:cyclophilin family peptidyl-prolyl cis-trans isomerase